MTFDWMAINATVGNQDNKHKELGKVRPTLVLMEETLNVVNTSQSSK
jgi:hypothetical protein